MKTQMTRYSLWLLSALTVGCGSYSNSASGPVATLTASSTTINEGESISFDASGSDYNSLSWNMNNSALSNCSDQELCSILMKEAGSYDVSVTATKGSSKTASVTIEVLGVNKENKKATVQTKDKAETTSDRNIVQRFWTPDVVLDSLSNDAYGSNCSISSDGTAMATFGQLNSAYSAFVNRFNGNSWGTASLLENFGTNVGISPGFSMGGNGKALTAWTESIFHIHGGYFNGTSWTAQQVDTASSTNALASYTAMNETGKGIIAWMSTASEIRSRNWNGSSWDADTFVASNGWTYASALRVAISDTGAVVIAWKDSDKKIYVNSSTNGTSWGTAVNVGTGDTSNNLELGMSTTGKALVAWDALNGVKQVQYSYYNGTSWSSSATVGNPSANVNGFDLGVGTANDAVMVYRQETSSGSGVYDLYSINFNGTSWNTPTLIESRNNNVTSPRVELSGGGNAMAVWQQSDGSQESIYASTYENGIWLAPTSPLETDATHLVRNPQVDLNPQGDAVVTWEQNNGTNYDLHGMIYK